MSTTLNALSLSYQINNINIINQYQTPSFNKTLTSVFEQSKPELFDL